MAEAARPKAHLASSYIRFFALLYDLMILFCLEFVIFIPMTFIESSIGPIAGTIKSALVISVAYAYFVGFWVKGGTTTGMRPWKLKLAMADSGDLTSPMVATIRFIGLMLTLLAYMLIVFYIYALNANNIEMFNQLFSSLPRQLIVPTFLLIACLPAISLLCMLLTRRRQTLHDLIAGTGVYRISE